MKPFSLIWVVFFISVSATAQVIVRNDFVFHRGHRKILNLGLTTVSINLDRHPNWNQLINGRGGRTMVIDLRALSKRRVVYSYSELAERVYVPPTATGPFFRPLPAFLLSGKPKVPYFEFKNPVTVPLGRYPLLRHTLIQNSEF